MHELPLLPNNTASEAVFSKSGRMRSCDWIFIVWALSWRWLDIVQNVLQSYF